MCPNHKICSDSTFISQVCHLAPIKLLTVNLDQILALTLGKVLYDPWLSQNTKVIYVSRDPRGIIFDRDQNCAQHQIVSWNILSIKKNVENLLIFSIYRELTTNVVIVIAIKDCVQEWDSINWGYFNFWDLRPRGLCKFIL